ncbi:MAG: shikimate dehydrogenase family protein [Ferrimicrobium sp.]
MSENAFIRPPMPLACVFGDPIEHSRSPSLHEGALRHLQLPGRYLAFQVGIPSLDVALRAIMALGFRGCNLTAPLKIAARRLLDDEDSDVRHIGAANTIVFEDGLRIGHNTDARGLVAALVEACGIDIAGRRVLVVGSGGAARAAVWAMLGAGAAQVLVTGRRIDRVVELVATFEGHCLVCEQTQGLSVDLVINATTAGMRGGGSEVDSAIDLAGFGEIGAVYDMVYDPVLTPLMASARAMGVPAFNGLTMLAGQARFAFEHFFGHLASLDVFLASTELTIIE